MKSKKSKIAIIVVSCLLVVALTAGITLYFLFGYTSYKWLAPGDEAIEAIDMADEPALLDMMENTWENAPSQTIVYSLIKDHFTSPLPEGKTEKRLS